jgi:hypothetical protein
VKAFAFDSYETSHVRCNGFDIGPSAYPELSIEVEFWPLSTVMNLKRSWFVSHDNGGYDR